LGFILNILGIITRIVLDFLTSCAIIHVSDANDTNTKIRNETMSNWPEWDTYQTKRRAIAERREMAQVMHDWYCRGSDDRLGLASLIAIQNDITDYFAWLVREFTR